MNLHVISSLRDGGAQNVLYQLAAAFDETVFVVVYLFGKGRY